MRKTDQFQFSAEYLDGAVYTQSETDRSIQDSSRNAFYDIQYRPIKPLDDLVRFTIYRDYPKHQRIAVDLRDGSFEIDGDRRMREIPDGKMRLYFSRRHFDSPGKFHATECRIGWVTPSGKQAIVDVLESFDLCPYPPGASAAGPTGGGLPRENLPPEKDHP